MCWNRFSLEILEKAHPQGSSQYCFVPQDVDFQQIRLLIQLFIVILTAFYSETPSFGTTDWVLLPARTCCDRAYFFKAAPNFTKRIGYFGHLFLDRFSADRLTSFAIRESTLDVTIVADYFSVLRFFPSLAVSFKFQVSRH